MRLITKRQLEILRIMRDDEEELVYYGGEAWLGNERVSSRSLFALLRVCAISLDTFSKVGAFERYHLNETGRSYIS